MSLVHFFSDHLSNSVISTITYCKTVRLINANQNVDCGGCSGHEPGSSVGLSLLFERVSGDVFANLSARRAMKVFPIKKNTITRCDIPSVCPLRRYDAFQVSKFIGSASESN